MPVAELGEEWIVDVYGCEPKALQDTEGLRSIAAEIVRDIGLHPLSDGFWFKFPGPGGVTGLIPLQESHLALHTYPEKSFATFNLYCCRSGCTWAWEERMCQRLRANRVVVRRIERGAQ